MQVPHQNQKQHYFRAQTLAGRAPAAALSQQHQQQQQQLFGQTQAQSGQLSHQFQLASQRQPPPPPAPLFYHNHTLGHQLGQHQSQHQPSLSLSSSQSQQNCSQNNSQLYNMNTSDYSSSSNYHVYDQINDLIIIKQQRMERRRQLDHRRKVILLGLAAALLLGTLAFLLMQALSALQPQPADPLAAAHPVPQPAWSPTPAWPFDANRLPPPRPPLVEPAPPPQQLLCSGRGQTVILATGAGLAESQQIVCKCDLGFRGERCEFGPYPPLDSGATYPAPNAPLAGCLATNCHGNGRCNHLGKCQCFAGFLGPHCQFRVSAVVPVPPPSVLQPSAPASTTTPSPPSTTTTPAPQPTQAPRPRCPNDCSGQGQCVRADPTSLHPEWRCQCRPGAAGDDCSSALERQCDDGIDNDQDGLVDCADSECCGDKVCQNSTLCMKRPDPLDILMRKQPPPPTSSFFKRMEFLVEKNSLQEYSHTKDFSESRASVIRGRVTYMRQGVTGVRVSVAGQLNLGITVTRDGGLFDLMVNGGGAVLVEFRREPFAVHQRAVRVPWNEIVLMDTIELALETPLGDRQQDASIREPPGAGQDQEHSPTCSAHNYRLMRPLVVAAPKSTRKSQHSSQLAARSSLGSKLLPAGQPQSSRAVILRDSQTVQQTIVLPGSSGGATSGDSSQNESVSLVYISSRANEFMSTISLQLTPESASGALKLPQELKSIHLKIVIEGILFEQSFEPQANLSFTYAWNRRNVYRQKSFGLSTARVSVGYEYANCRRPIWSTKHIQLPGHDLSVSDIGAQWNLNVHHRYNYRDAILQRGDGQNFDLKTDKPRVVQQLMGDGYQRQLVCPYCDASATLGEQRLYRPQALVAAPDGALYVGDHNLVRRVEPAATPSGRNSAAERSVRTVVELAHGRTPSRYSLALNPVDQRLYMADPERRQVFLVREASRSELGANSSADVSAEETLVPVVGSGLKCQPDDGTNCGDGQPAKSARLQEPRAIAFDLSNRVYIADGATVRMVDVDGKIYTILGDYELGQRHRHARPPFPCQADAIPMHQFSPRAPLDLALNPLDETLHILDDNVVYRVTPDKRLQIVAGRPAHCLAEPAESVRNTGKLRASQVFLQSAQSIAFNQNGELFVVEDDQKLISRILLVSPAEDAISLFAGQPLEQSQLSNAVAPTVDSLHLDSQPQLQSQSSNQQPDASRSSNILPLSSTTRATDYKFSAIAAIAVDQRGALIVADKVQLRVMSVEPDLPQVNAAGEYELQSPDNSDELLVFNRFGHHVATRELLASSQRSPNKYTFAYSVNTSFGQLASVTYATGNKISIYRDGPHHSVKMIETALGGQCKLEVSRNGQVHSISTTAPNSTRTNFAYHVDGGLLKQSRDQASGESFEFTYDEFGRALAIQHSSPRLASPLECRVSGVGGQSRPQQPPCASLIIAE